MIGKRSGPFEHKGQRVDRSGPKFNGRSEGRTAGMLLTISIGTINALSSSDEFSGRVPVALLSNRVTIEITNGLRPAKTVTHS
jgi:hypothetical protein